MRSDNVTKGSERAPNRSLFYALGYTPEELERPLIGVVSAYSEIVPGHMNLDKIADAVKAGVEMAGGTPILIPAIGVCDGIAMGHVGMKYSLASRELICDSVETMLMAHQLDGLVLVPNCDKIVPGMVMAAVRMDVPAVVCSGGPMLAGSYGGEEVSLSKMFEAVGAFPGSGACGIRFPKAPGTRSWPLPSRWWPRCSRAGRAPLPGRSFPAAVRAVRRR